MLICLCKWFDCLTQPSRSSGPRPQFASYAAGESGPISGICISSSAEHESVWCYNSLRVKPNKTAQLFTPRQISLHYQHQQPNPSRRPATAATFSWQRRESRTAQHCPGLDYLLQTQTLQSGKSIHYIWVK